MHLTSKFLSNRLGKPIANVSFALMYRQVRAIERSGVSMMHTARPFSYYRKVFYQGRSEASVIQKLDGKRVVDIGCGYTPFADDSMFRACHDAGLDFYGVDPIIGQEMEFGFKERALARALGSQARFNTKPPGFSRALSCSAQDLPFEDCSVDEILCSYLLFVWIEKEAVLTDILREFLRVLKPGATIKVYPLYEWRYIDFRSSELRKILNHFMIEQRFVHGGLDFRVTPSMLTTMTKLS